MDKNVEKLPQSRQSGDHRQPEPTANAGREWWGMSGSTLKLIALGSMLVDHLAASGVLSKMYDSEPLYEFCRTVGRIAFPLFCFLLVEGFVYTRNRKAYLIRLFLFALLSEVPFDLAFFGTPCHLAAQNVFFTLFLGFLSLCGVEELRNRGHAIWVWAPMLSGFFAAFLLHTDYSGFGVILILIFYWFRDVPWQRNLISGFSCLGEPAAILSLIPIQFYNGKRGIPLKFIFYLFYPLHLLLFVLIRGMI